MQQAVITPADPPEPTIIPGDRRYRYDAQAEPAPEITEPEEPAPACGIRFGTAETLEATIGSRAHAPVGYIDPVNVDRSARIGNELSLDYSLRGLMTPWRWPR